MTLPISRMATTAERRWSTEQSGPLVHKLLRQVAGDPVLKAAVASGRASAVQAAVNARFRSVRYHWHVSRIRTARRRPRSRSPRRTAGRRRPAPCSPGGATRQRSTASR